MKTKVIFRTFTDTKETIALFPLEPADQHGWNCMSYMHVGQHGVADPHIVHGGTRPATPAEVCDLACELRGLGYKLEALRRFPSNAYALRKTKLAAMLGLFRTK